MTDQGFVDLLASFSDLDLNKCINNINILKQISLKYPDKLPITKKDVTNICNQFKYRLKHKLDHNNIYYFRIPNDKSYRDFLENRGYQLTSEHESLVFDTNKGLYNNLDYYLSKPSKVYYTDDNLRHIIIYLNAFDRKTLKYQPDHNVIIKYDNILEDFIKQINQLDFKHYLYTYDYNDYDAKYKFLYKLKYFFNDIINYAHIYNYTGINLSYYVLRAQNQIWAVNSVYLYHGSYNNIDSSDYEEYVDENFLNIVNYLKKKHIPYKIEYQFQRDTQNQKFDPQYYQYLTQKYPNFIKYNDTLFNSSNENTYFLLQGDILKYAKAALVIKKLLIEQSTYIDSNVAQAAAKLIYYQQQQYGIKFKKSERIKTEFAKFNKTMQLFLQNYHLPNSDSDISIKIGDLAKYMADILQARPINDKMLELIATASDNSSLDIILNQAKKFKLFDCLKPVSNQIKQSVLEKLPTNIAKNVIHVYAVPPQHDITKFNHVKTLTHGTPNRSVLSILSKGLLDSATLEKENNKYYDYTGSGLGVGIYFTRPQQVEKSLNYTSDHNINYYIFMADVGYNDTINVNYYSESPNKINDGDLVWAHGVGSYNRDELVVPNTNQVNIKYLLEFKPS